VGLAALPLSERRESLFLELLRTDCCRRHVNGYCRTLARVNQHAVSITRAQHSLCGIVIPSVVAVQLAALRDAEIVAREPNPLAAGGNPLESPEDATRSAQTSVVTLGGRIGPYQLVRQLGEGGMGVVYHAQQLQPIRRDVALKVIKPGMDSKQVIARFESERQALAMMDHANIAHVFEAGTTSTGLPYFVMELVDGIPITRYCDSKRLTVRDIRRASFTVISSPRTSW
jgi:hypothetical protein